MSSAAAAAVATAAATAAAQHWGAERHKATFSDQQKRKKSSFSFYKCFLYMCFFNYSMCQILYAMWIWRKVFKDIITTEADSGRPKILFRVFDVCNVLHCGNWFNLSKYATSKKELDWCGPLRIYLTISPFPLNITYLEWLSERSIWCLHFYTCHLLHPINFLDQFIFTHTLYIDDI